MEWLMVVSLGEGLVRAGRMGSCDQRQGPDKAGSERVMGGDKVLARVG